MIVDCINSALSQTYRNIEVIVVDNASTDNTWEICKSNFENNDKVHLFQNSKNIGPVQNWKKAINLASGFYSKILFSDDLLLPECLEEMIKLFSNETAFVFSSVLTGDSINNSFVNFAWGMKKTKSIEISNLKYINYSLFSYGALVSPGAALFRTSDLRNNFIDQLPGYDNRGYSYFGAGPDLLFFLLTAIKYKYVMHIPRPLVFFRDHDDSATTKALTDKKWPIRESYNRTRLWFVENNLGESYISKMAARIWFTETFAEKQYKYIIKPTAVLSQYFKPKKISLFSFILMLPYLSFSAGKYLLRSYLFKNSS